MVKWLGISALAVGAFVAFMETGTGSAAESGAASPKSAASGTAAKEAGPAKDGAPAKPGAAAATGKDAKADAKPDLKTDKVKADSAAKSPETDKTTTAAKETSGQAHHAKSKRKHDGAAGEEEPALPPGQGPPPPSPLTVNDLHQEANRDRSPGGDFNAPPRVKLEQLLTEVGKARQSLHDDTLKLEALAGNEPKETGAAGGDAPAAAAPGAPQKNPLDVLAKALRGIKPEQAGPIVARLDKGLAATVLLKMPPVDAGKIMGALKPEVAAELATQIAMRAPSSQTGVKR